VVARLLTELAETTVAVRGARVTGLSSTRKEEMNTKGGMNNEHLDWYW
jgi:hypothetical protein